MPECPDCESKQVEKRKMNIPRNVKLRSIGTKHDPYVCRECGWTGEEDELTFDPHGGKYGHASATEW